MAEIIVLFIASIFNTRLKLTCRAELLSRVEFLTLKPKPDTGIWWILVVSETDIKMDIL